MLHVVLILEHLEQLETLLGLLTVEADGVLRFPDDTGELGVDAGLLD